MKILQLIIILSFFLIHDSFAVELNFETINFRLNDLEWNLKLPYAMGYKMISSNRQKVLMQFLTAKNEKLFIVFISEKDSDAAKLRYNDAKKYYNDNFSLELIGGENQKQNFWNATLYKTRNQQFENLFVFFQYEQYVAFVQLDSSDITDYDIKICKGIIDSWRKVDKTLNPETKSQPERKVNRQWQHELFNEYGR